MTTHAQTAKAIRQELKAKFPSIKFSVTSSSFSMGDDVRVDWENGPTVKEVEEITDKYEEGTFDGMIDLYEYDNRRDDIPQVKYVMTSRHISEEIMEETTRRIAESFGISNIQDDKEWFNIFHSWDARRTVAYRELADKSL
jgi:hypothetical protein